MRQAFSALLLLLAYTLCHAEASLPFRLRQHHPTMAAITGGSTELASPLSASLFAATRAEALHSLRHPFVLQLATGQLPKVSAAPA